LFILDNFALESCWMAQKNWPV